jgi:hypothetical protein
MMLYKIYSFFSVNNPAPTSLHLVTFDCVVIKKNKPYVRIKPDKMFENTFGIKKISLREGRYDSLSGYLIIKIYFHAEHVRSLEAKYRLSIWLLTADTNHLLNPSLENTQLKIRYEGTLQNFLVGFYETFNIYQFQQENRRKSNKNMQIALKEASVYYHYCKLQKRFSIMKDNENTLWLRFKPLLRQQRYFGIKELGFLYYENNHEDNELVACLTFDLKNQNTQRSFKLCKRYFSYPERKSHILTVSLKSHRISMLIICDNSPLAFLEQLSQILPICPLLTEPAIHRLWFHWIENFEFMLLQEGLKTYFPSSKR